MDKEPAVSPERVTVSVEEQIAWMVSMDGDEETTHPMCKSVLRSLRRVAALENLHQAAKYMLVVIDARAEGRGMDVAYDAATTTANFRSALAALDGMK